MLVESLLVVILALLGACLFFLTQLSRKAGGQAFQAQFDLIARGLDKTEKEVRNEFAQNRDEATKAAKAMREEAASASKQLREEVSGAVKSLGDSVLQQMKAASAMQESQLKIFSQQLVTLTQSNEARLDRTREEAAASATALREGVGKTVQELNNSVLLSMSELTKLLQDQFHHFSQQLRGLSESSENRLETLRGTVESKLTEMREENVKKLDEMRATVDEKLQGTLEKRLGEAFKIVSERLELVHKGLGEMQTLALGVGDLKKVLTNVKTRGTWGEIQLGNLLEQMLTPEQYAANVCPKPSSKEVVEFAVKLPGRAEDKQEIVWLPIDSKFPQEDYQRLLDAQEMADPALVETASKDLEIRIKGCARDIRDKYISPPHTTDFGIMFLPTEGLYAEVLRRPGLVEQLQREYRVMVAGPTNLGAFLNSLQMGFRTLAIQKRSSEVWKTLGMVKTEFGKFGDILDKVQKKLQEATNTIDDAAKKSRTIETKLKKVQELPSDEARVLLVGSIEEPVVE